jgi:hypothetical protein
MNPLSVIAAPVRLFPGRPREFPRDRWPDKIRLLLTAAAAFELDGYPAGCEWPVGG